MHGGDVVRRASRGGAGVAQRRTFEYDNLMSLIVPIFLAVFAVAEPLRLYLGFSGNLHEKVAMLCDRVGGCEARVQQRAVVPCTQVSNMSAFLLLTAFPTVPVAAFLSFLQRQRMPIEIYLGIPFFVFVVRRAAAA
jgi:hypothetical protein